MKQWSLYNPGNPPLVSYCNVFVPRQTWNNLLYMIRKKVLTHKIIFLILQVPFLLKIEVNTGKAKHKLERKVHGQRLRKSVTWIEYDLKYRVTD